MNFQTWFNPLALGYFTLGDNRYGGYPGYNTLYNVEEFNYRSYGYHNTMTVLGWILGIALIFLAVYLSWNCTYKESLGVRILYALVAGIFDYIYLIYYFIYRVLLGNKCY